MQLLFWLDFHTTTNAPGWRDTLSMHGTTSGCLLWTGRFWPALAVLVFLIHDARHFLFHTGPYKSKGQTYLDSDKLFWFRGPYSCGFCFYLGPKQCLSLQIDSSRCIFVDETDQSGHLRPISGKLSFMHVWIISSQHSYEHLLWCSKRIVRCCTWSLPCLVFLLGPRDGIAAEWESRNKFRWRKQLSELDGRRAVKIEDLGGILWYLVIAKSSLFLTWGSSL